MGAIEPWHLILVLAVALLVLGPKRLPEVGRSLGETIREFRRSAEDPNSTATGTAASTAPVAPDARAQDPAPGPTSGPLA